MKRSVRTLLLWVLLLWSVTLVGGCSNDDRSSWSVNVSPLVSPLTSPLPTSAAEAEPPRGPDFRIDPGVKAGDTIVRGTGPAGVEINIVDVSWVGEVKGTGVIEPDGTFAIEVTPVEGGNRLGVMLADLGDSGLQYEDFRNNENYQDLPMVGLLVYYLDVPAE